MLGRSLAALAGAAVLAFLTMPASAVSVSPTLPTLDGAGTPLVQRIHGCHGNVQRDSWGWHYHRGSHCRRIDTEAPFRRDRFYGGPRCWRDCNYVGPIKVCKTKCRDW